MNPGRLRPKWKGSGWSMSGAIQTVMHAIIAWGLYGLWETKLLSDGALTVVVVVTVVVTTCLIARIPSGRTDPRTGTAECAREPGRCSNRDTPP